MLVGQLVAQLHVVQWKAVVELHAVAAVHRVA